ncbi:adenylate/guanylate cyclase domain-containing protein [Spirochaetia bacterium]|nr:adenylate/guanylate cyclase domain-containing protein [Spirochaetia bacterium]
MERKQKKARPEITVRRPIGVTLVSIITILLLTSLGAITALMSYMVSEDLRINAEDTNFAINRRSAAETDRVLRTARSNALLLLDTLSTPGSRFQSLFFEQHPEIAAVVPNGRMPITNEGFFRDNELDPYLVWQFMENAVEARNRARMGETVLLNAAPAFGVPLLAMFIPSAGIFFTSDELTDDFGRTINISFLINDAGEILIHPDNQLVMAGVDIGSSPLAEQVRSGREQNFQILYEDAGGREYLGAFRKLSLGGAAVLTTVEYRLIFESITATTRRNIFLTLAVLFTAIIIIWFFSKGISKPLMHLTETAGMIEKGDFEVRLPQTRGDEIGVLGDSFVRMGKALTSLSYFTNQEITRKAMQGNLSLGGEPRMVTLLFTDIRSFTMISEMLEPAEVVEFLNAYMTRMIVCIEQTGGSVDKFMGDAIMAHWGAVSITESPAENALNGVKAALAMRSALRDFNAGRDGSIKQPRIRIGCGLNSGPVVAGQVGSNTRMEYTVIGDTVNLASRTEGLNKDFMTDILITENTWDLIKEDIIAEEMLSTKVKGKKDPVRLFAVINLRAKPGEKQKRPVNLTEVRTMLGLRAPDLKRLILQMEADERK